MAYQRRRDPCCDTTHWYDREGSARQLLSTSVADMYLPHYFQGLVTDSIAVKTGTAALLSVLAIASGAFGQLFWVTVFVWAADIVFGVTKALIRGGFRLSKLLDGVLRGMVIVLLPPILAMVGEVALEPLRAVFAVDVPLDVGLATFGCAVLLAHEVGSLFDNVAQLHPGAHQLRAKLVSWTPGGEVKERPVEVAILEPGGEREK